MEFRADPDLCVGHGRCWTVAADVYDADDDGFVIPRGVQVSVPPASEDLARKGARSCPEGAIDVIDK